MSVVQPSAMVVTAVAGRANCLTGAACGARQVPGAAPTPRSKVARPRRAW